MISVTSGVAADAWDACLRRAEGSIVYASSSYRALLCELLSCDDISLAQFRRKMLHYVICLRDTVGRFALRCNLFNQLLCVQNAPFLCSNASIEDACDDDVICGRECAHVLFLKDS